MFVHPYYVYLSKQKICTTTLSTILVCGQLWWMCSLQCRDSLLQARWEISPARLNTLSRNKWADQLIKLFCNLPHRSKLGYWGSDIDNKNTISWSLLSMSFCPWEFSTRRTATRCLVCLTLLSVFCFGGWRVACLHPAMPALHRSSICILFLFRNMYVNSILFESPSERMVLSGTSNHFLNGPCLSMWLLEKVSTSEFDFELFRGYSSCLLAPLVRLNKCRHWMCAKKYPLNHLLKYAIKMLALHAKDNKGVVLILQLSSAGW